MTDSITPEWFLNVSQISAPKDIDSLTSLWEHLFEVQASVWLYGGQQAKSLNENLENLRLQAERAGQDDKANQDLTEQVKKTPNLILLGITRAFHVKTFLQDIEKATKSVEEPPGEQDSLTSKLILQSFMDYLSKNGAESFSELINLASLRLVSTVHPNETERNTTLLHFNTVFELYITWINDHSSLRNLSSKAPEYRMRREKLNQLRRAIKAEIEAVWQSNRRREDPISVESEARRLTARYKTIFKALPGFIKFVKLLAIEAFWRYKASEYSKNPEWLQVFQKFYNQDKTQTRESQLKAIKRAFQTLEIEVQVPRITSPILTFSTWRGGDRDGNPFVVASFSNQTFIEQKLFILTHYYQMVKELSDKLNISTKHIAISDALVKSLDKDRIKFPYLTDIKPIEPYRAKIRYIIEKLENTLRLVRSIMRTAGSTTKPLLGQTLPGPAGYNLATEFQEDINVVYHSLVENHGKAQARSLVQDLKILADTFGFHLTSIDFRQLSQKNANAVRDYLRLIQHPLADPLFKMSEPEKQQALLDLVCSSDIEFDPWVISSLPDISRDTFQTFLIFADASKADPFSVGKFIISMCSHTSDILMVLFLMRLVGMLEADGGSIKKCPFDVTGLFETVEDLKQATRITSELLTIPLIREYICRDRGGKITIMLGYSDSVRDGSSLASDSQIIRTSIELKELESRLNKNISAQQKVRFILYRGRGDTIPRGFGGSIERAVTAQLFVTSQEDHTEQNRYLRRYATVSSTIDHLHSIYSAHLSVQVAPLPTDLNRYQSFYDFFGSISNLKWNNLVQPETHGNVYFKILNTYTILPHLSKSHFASRPVAREGQEYNVNTIRAIPFVMVLAQMREFSSGYYGTGTAFMESQRILEDFTRTPLLLLKAYIEVTKDSNASKLFVKPKYASLKELLATEDPKNLIEKAIQLPEDTLFNKILGLYNSRVEGILQIAYLLVDLKRRGLTVLETAQEMYKNYTPFAYSMQNKETSLTIRNKKIVDDYTREATAEEKEVLKMTEDEAQLTISWLLKITGQKKLFSKMLSTDFNSPELILLHKIQNKFLEEYRTTTDRTAKSELGILIQMSILAIAEALGFGG